MEKRKAVVLALGLVMLMLVSTFGSTLPAFAGSGDGPYTVTVRYYDSIQVTYIGTDFAGGAWESRGDVPIGGTEVAAQAYCVDPFVSFHKLADTTGWDSVLGATVDAKGGYAAAAPWNASVALQQYGDAVRWLVLNGYRGDFLADDQASQDSVDRLQGLYGYVGDIDKTIALMATKIAIWKAVTNDRVDVVSTSLDDVLDKRDTLDALIQGMLSDALSGRETGLAATELALEVKGSAELRFSDSGSNPAYGYYGPLRFEVKLLNQGVDSSYRLAVDKVYLAIQGIALDDVDVVYANRSPLEKGRLFGTDSEALYLDKGATDGSGIWVSDDVYLKAPINRHHITGAPLSSDLLSIRAMVRAADVPLAEGTPLTFVYESAGMQEWDAVQAFIGGADEYAKADLYASARLDTGESAYGNLYLAKQVYNGIADQEYTFKVYASHEPEFAEVTTANLADYRVLPGRCINADHSITVKNGDMVEIDGLPSDLYYWVEEIDAPDGCDTAYSVEAVTVEDLAEGTLAGPIRMDCSGAYGVATVTFINTFPAPEEEADGEEPVDTGDSEDAGEPDDAGEPEGDDAIKRPGSQGDGDEDMATQLVTRKPSIDEAPEPANPGASLTYNGQGSYTEIHHDGTALGEWKWDEGEEDWLFDGQSPLGNLAPTGDNRIQAGVYLAGAVILLGICCAACRRRVERKHSA
ncbi:MAG: Cys-Gln thioester bond-forming surface protein [Clostridiales bacterium]|nr:Cys-Gln thioester bond-forming surface protein [Clostridiales bacterium]